VYSWSWNHISSLEIMAKRATLTTWIFAALLEVSLTCSEHSNQSCPLKVHGYYPIVKYMIPIPEQPTASHKEAFVLQRLLEKYKERLFTATTMQEDVHCRDPQTLH
jgi:hypothetical protein